MYTDFGERDGRGDDRDASSLAQPSERTITDSLAQPSERTITGVLCGDSSAAIAIGNRRGLNKLKHIRLGELWIQEKVHSGEIDMRKVHGEANVADLFTKHVAEVKIEQYCGTLNCKIREGRSDLGLRMQKGKQGGNARAV